MTLEKNKQKVLFVDDEESCCEIFKELMDEYYDTTTCMNPLMAMKILKQKHFDAIVSDQNMPVMTGTELFKKVATEVPSTAMVALTGLSDTKEINEAINNDDIFYYIKKPWEISDMHSIIQSAIKDKQAKIKLKESEKLIKASFEQATVGFAHLNPDGSFIRINQKFSDILQQSELLILSNNLYNLISPEDRVKNGIEIANLLENDISSLTYIINFIRSRNENVTCKLTLSVVRDLNKQPLFIVAMLEDITNQKENENELLISHELLRQIPNAILVMDLDGIIIRWIGYAEKIFGYTESEITGKHISTLYSQPIRSKISQELISEIEKNDFFKKEIVCIRKDHTEILIEAIASKVFDQNGEAIAIISIHQDITENRKVMKELEDYKNNLEKMVQKRTKDIEYANQELKKHASELEKFNKAMVGRELKIISLKEEINKLSHELGRTIPYPPVWNDNTSKNA